MLTFLWWYQCSGKILHIDFGDCFEASMNREKFPEKVGLLQCTVLLVIFFIIINNQFVPVLIFALFVLTYVPLISRCHLGLLVCL